MKQGSSLKGDILDRMDLELISDIFFDSLMLDAAFCKLFNSANVDLDAHKQRFTDFLEHMLFKVGKYHVDVLKIHVELNRSHQFNAAYFKCWVRTFNKIVDNLYNGGKASELKNRVFSLASLIKVKIEEIERKRLELNN